MGPRLAVGEGADDGSRWMRRGIAVTQPQASSPIWVWSVRSRIVNSSFKGKATEGWGAPEPWPRDRAKNCGAPENSLSISVSFKLAMMRFSLRTGRGGLPSALSTVPGAGGDGNGLSLFELRVDRGDCGVSDDGDMDETCLAGELVYGSTVALYTTVLCSPPATLN